MVWAYLLVIIILCLCVCLSCTFLILRCLKDRVIIKELTSDIRVVPAELVSEDLEVVDAIIIRQDNTVPELPIICSQ